jgi:RNA polymerase-interacting CarD/CdnL/TRCF family regulator
MAKLTRIIKSKRKAISKYVKKKIRNISGVSRVRKHFDFIKKLASVSKNLNATKKLLKSASPGEILALAEIVLNLLRRNIPLTVTQKRILCPFRNRLREIASKRTNCAAKRKVFHNQKGGILGIIGTILSVAIPAITSLISSFSSKN